MPVLHKYNTLRPGREVWKTEKLTPIKAIKEHCYNCSGGFYAEIKKCAIKSCPLYPFRLGKAHAKKI